MSDKRLPPVAELRARYNALQAGDYRPEVLKAATELSGRVRSNSVAVDRLDSLTAANLAAESLDYLGMYSDARDCLHDCGPRVRREIEVLLRDAPSAVDAAGTEKWLLWRAKISLLLNFAYTFYRQEDYEAALRILLLANDGLTRLEGGSQGSYGTRWRLHYRLGQTYRQLNRFTEAEAHFTKAIDLAAHRLMKKAPSGQRGPQEEADAFAVSHWMVAKPLALGLGWLYWAEGRVNEAKPLLLAGQTLLHGTHDWLHLAYVRLLNACIHRTEGSRDAVVLEAVISELKDVYRIYTDTHAHPHRHPYSIRAAYELAYSYHLLSKTPIAKKYVNEVITEAAKGGVGRWHSLGLTLLSRIELNSKNPTDRERAVGTAAQALREAELLSQDRCRVEALIACGEAEMEASFRALRPEGKTAARARAETHLLRALGLTSDNPKHNAACHLHLARIAIAEGNDDKARAHLDVWERTFKFRVESKWLHAYADIVRRERDHLNVFSLDLTVDMKYEECKARLQAFLLKRAEEKAGDNAKDVAALLDVSRQTVYEWRGRIGGNRESTDTKPDLQAMQGTGTRTAQGRKVAVPSRNRSVT